MADSAIYCNVEQYAILLIRLINTFDVGGRNALGVGPHCSIALSKSRSQRLRTNSKTERFLCGNSWANMSIALSETTGWGVAVIGQFIITQIDFIERMDILLGLDFSGSGCVLFGETHGSVTFIPKIFPGGNTSSDAPLSFEASRNAIASSTACCLFRAT